MMIKKSLLLGAVIAPLLTVSSAHAVTIKFSHAGRADASALQQSTGGASMHSDIPADANTSIVNSANELMRENMDNSIQINKLHGEINILKDELEKEKVANDIKGRGGDREIYLGNWTLDPTRTLQENLQLWVQEASIETGKDIRLLWMPDAPGTFQVPFRFKGTWIEAFTQLGNAMKSSGWPVAVSINTRMNTITVSDVKN